MCTSEHIFFFKKCDFACAQPKSLFLKKKSDFEYEHPKSFKHITQREHNKTHIQFIFLTKKPKLK